MATATATKKPAARKPVYREGLSDPLERVTYGRNWRPGVKFDPDTQVPTEITTDAVFDGMTHEDAVRELGVQLPSGYKLVLVDVTFHQSTTEHSWTRGEQGEDAVTQPNRSRRVQWKFKVVKDEKKGDDLDTTMIFDRVEKMWKKVHRPDRRRYTKRRTGGTAMLVLPADDQVGKNDKYGGTPELLERHEGLLEKIILEVEEVRPDVIYNIHGGDLIENIFNVSTQIAENDLPLNEQIEVGLDLRSMWLAELSQYAPVHHGMVPSNHGRVRTSMGTAAGTPKSDFGVSIESMAHKHAVARGLDVTLHQADTEHDEWLLIPVYDTNYAALHGHQVKGAAKGLDTFVNKHTTNRSPFWWADLVGIAHNHDDFDISLGRGPSGYVRRAIGMPALDGGSAWFEQFTGANSDPGITTLLIREGYGYDRTSLKRWILDSDLERRRAVMAINQ